MRNGKNSKPIYRACGLVVSAVAITGCTGTDPATTASTSQGLKVECLDEPAPMPEAWMCPQPLTLECGDPRGSTPDILYVQPAQGSACENTRLTLDSEGPFSLGHHVVRVFDDSATDASAGDAAFCEAALNVVDTTAPAVLEKKPLLWPPNHSWRTISIDDCFQVADRCDPDVSATVLWADSDEPFDDLGDGNTEPDIRFLGCDLIQVRAERQGTGNGRVYRIGWLLQDDSGNTAQATCEVGVPHDHGRGAEPVASPPVEELENSATCQTPTLHDAGCDAAQSVVDAGQSDAGH